MSHPLALESTNGHSMALCYDSNNGNGTALVVYKRNSKYLHLIYGSAPLHTELERNI